MPAARGRGLVTRAARLVADWAFGELGILQLRLDILPDNAASLRVVERLGCTRQPDRVVREWDEQSWEMVRFVLRAG